MRRGTNSAHHFETNDAATNDNHLLGDLLERNRAGTCDDPLLVNGQAGERCRFGTSRDEDVLRLHGGLTAVNEVDGDGVLILEGAGALDVLNVVLLEQELDALGQARHGGILGLHQLLDVDLDIADLNSAVLAVVQDLVVQVRVVKERLGGDAADVKAGSAKSAALLDTGNLKGHRLDVIRGLLGRSRTFSPA